MSHQKKGTKGPRGRLCRPRFQDGFRDNETLKTWLNDGDDGDTCQVEQRNLLFFFLNSTGGKMQ